MIWNNHLLCNFTNGPSKFYVATPLGNDFKPNLLERFYGLFTRNDGKFRHSGKHQ